MIGPLGFIKLLFDSNASRPRITASRHLTGSQGKALVPSSGAWSVTISRR